MTSFYARLLRPMSHHSRLHGCAGGAAAAIVAYDITDRQTFDDLPKFCAMLAEARPDCAVVVVGASPAAPHDGLTAKQGPSTTWSSTAPNRCSTARATATATQCMQQVRPDEGFQFATNHVRLPGRPSHITPRSTLNSWRRRR